jgi:hypothetical protein
MHRYCYILVLFCAAAQAGVFPKPREIELRQSSFALREEVPILPGLPWTKVSLGRKFYIFVAPRNSQC